MLLTEVVAAGGGFPIRLALAYRSPLGPTLV